MKLKLQFILFLLLQSIVFAQCPPDGVFNSQAEIDALVVNYPNCDQLGTLSISGADINDLTPFSNINLIDGLNINNNLLLTTLVGLENIEITTIIGNQSGLIIINNPILTSMEYLPGFQNPTSAIVSIQNNPLLENLIGLSHTEVADAFIIRNNNTLVDLTGLDNLVFAGPLVVEDNDGLIDLTGISPDFASGLILINNSSLQSLNGLDSAPREFGFEITDNVSLTDISQVSSYNLIGFNLSGNTSLSDCSISSICYALNNVPSDIFFINNATGCNSIEEVQAECTQCPT